MRIKIFNSCKTEDLETEINDWFSKNESSIIIQDMQIRPCATAHSCYSLGYVLYNIKPGEVPKEIIDKRAEEFLTDLFPNAF